MTQQTQYIPDLSEIYSQDSFIALLFFLDKTWQP